MEYKKVKLFEICKPKQWRTISTSKLIKEGYSVYGANGIIGYFSEFTHEFPTLTITCRGATCGELHITKPFSYINGNAMALDSLSKNINIKYLYYYLKLRKFNDVISGSAQPQITRQGLKKIEVPLPPMDIQIRIANALDKAQELIDHRKTQIKKYDELLQSVFLDMFGDPVTNPKEWEVKKLDKILNNIDSGWSPKCSDKKATNDNWGVLKLSAVTGGKYNQEKNKELPSELTPKPEKEVKQGDLLMTRKNTPELVGDCAYVFETKPNLMMPDLVFRFDTKVGVDKKYLWKLFTEKKFKNKIKELAGGSAKSMSNISKAKLKELKIILPPVELQNQFAEIVEKVEMEKKKMGDSLAELENNFNSIMQRAFKGELF